MLPDMASYIKIVKIVDRRIINLAVVFGDAYFRYAIKQELWARGEDL